MDIWELRMNQATSKCGWFQIKEAPILWIHWTRTWPWKPIILGYQASNSAVSRGFLQKAKKTQHGGTKLIGQRISTGCRGSWCPASWFQFNSLSCLRWLGPAWPIWSYHFGQVEKKWEKQYFFGWIWKIRKAHHGKELWTVEFVVLWMWTLECGSSKTIRLGPFLVLAIASGVVSKFGTPFHAMVYHHSLRFWTSGHTLRIISPFWHGRQIWQWKIQRSSRLPAISPWFFLHKLGFLILFTTMAIPSSTPWQPPFWWSQWQ